MSDILTASNKFDEKACSLSFQHFKQNFIRQVYLLIIRNYQMSFSINRLKQQATVSLLLSLNINYLTERNKAKKGKKTCIKTVLYLSDLFQKIY
jgi:hypothetical protein